MATAETTPEMDALKTKLKATWMAGDFGVIAGMIEKGGDDFVDSIGVKPGMKVLDVACGTGNTAIPEAKKGAEVIGVDIATNLIEQARQRAKAEGLQIKFEEGDVEDLQFPDASFDAVVTMFGAMFAPRPDVTASEMIRVTKPGGFIAMGNWTPEAFVGQMFKIGSAHVPPPPGMSVPVQWGSEDIVRQRFADGISDLQMSRRKIIFTYDGSPADVVDLFRQYFGPTNRAFASLDEAGQDALRKDLVDLWKKHNQAAGGTTKVQSEYLEVIARKA
jgi:Methylase involved in ubiquinone/menaquinone biosynthesis